MSDNQLSKKGDDISFWSIFTTVLLSATHHNSNDPDRVGKDPKLRVNLEHMFC